MAKAASSQPPTAEAPVRIRANTFEVFDATVGIETRFCQST